MPSSSQGGCKGREITLKEVGSTEGSIWLSMESASGVLIQRGDVLRKLKKFEEFKTILTVYMVKKSLEYVQNVV